MEPKNTDGPSIRNPRPWELRVLGASVGGILGLILAAVVFHEELGWVAEGGGGPFVSTAKFALILTPLIGAVAGVLVVSSRGRSGSAGGVGKREVVKVCPMCAEHVKVEARICRFCRHQFSHASGREERS